MSRSSSCIQMLQLLKARGMMSREELANELECSCRAVLEYKKELEQCGYQIDSTTGKYGGYALQRGVLLPVINFQSNEVRALKEARHYINCHQDFLLLEPFEKAMDKIQANITMDASDSGVYVEQFHVLSNRMLKFIQLCEQGKKDQQCVELHYRSLRSGSVENVSIHPYEILNYKGFYYCLAYSLKAKDFRMYKFSEERMKNCVLLTTRFTRNRDFLLKDHIGKSGLIKDQIYELDMYVYHESARRIAEKPPGFDITMEWLDDDTLHFSTIMEGRIDTINFLLSLKDECKLLSPESIRIEMMKIIEDMQAVYSHSS